MTKDPLQFRLDLLYKDHHYRILLVHTICGKQSTFNPDDANEDVTLNDLLLWGWKHECDENLG